MSRIIVNFKEKIRFDVQTEHAVVEICHQFGYCSPWFNDDAWLEDDYTLIIGSGYRKDDVEGRIAKLLQTYHDQIETMYEEGD